MAIFPLLSYFTLKHSNHKIHMNLMEFLTAASFKYITNEKFQSIYKSIFHLLRPCDKNITQLPISSGLGQAGTQRIGLEPELTLWSSHKLSLV